MIIGSIRFFTSLKLHIVPQDKAPHYIAVRERFIIAISQLCFSFYYGFLAFRQKMAGQPMVEKQFNLELTKAGQQFVIPGTEKPTPVPKKRYTKDGNQLVIPGAEQISPKEFVARLAKKPISPRVGQRSLAGTALFGHGSKK